MPKRSETQLEKLKLGQQGWNEVLSANMEKLNDILLKVDGLLDVDISNLATGDVLWWNATSQKFENVNKAYAVSAASVSSWSSESSISSVSSISSESSISSISSETYSSESSESSESSVSIISSVSSVSSVSSESSESSCSGTYVGVYGTDFTGGQTYSSGSGTASNAFDNNYNTTWYRFGGVDDYDSAWVQVKLSVAKIARRFRMQVYDIDNDEPRDFTVKASNTGAFSGEEVTLVNQTGVGWGSNAWRTYDFANSTPYLYYRMHVSWTDAGNSNSRVQIREIEYMELEEYCSQSSSSESSESSHTSVSSETISSSSVSSESLTLYDAKIGIDGDDGYAETGGGGFSASANVATFGNVSGTGYRSFFRFDGVTIPKDSTIESAVLRLTAYSTQEISTVNLNIYFEEDVSDDPVAPTSGVDLTGRSLGSAVAWDSLGNWSSGTKYDSVDISTILETAVARTNWVSGQALIIHIINDGSSSSARKQVDTREESTVDCAELIVRYK